MIHYILNNNSHNPIKLQFHALYFLSFLLTMTGIYIYAIKKTPIAGSDQHHHHQNHQNHNHQHNDGPYDANSTNTSEMVVDRISSPLQQQYDQQLMNQQNQHNELNVNYMDSPDDFNSSK